VSSCQEEVESGLEIAGHSLSNSVTRVESKIDLRLSSHHWDTYCHRRTSTRDPSYPTGSYVCSRLLPRASTQLRATHAAASTAVNTFNVNWLQQGIDNMHLLFGDLALGDPPPKSSYTNVTIVLEDYGAARGYQIATALEEIDTGEHGLHVHSPAKHGKDEPNGKRKPMFSSCRLSRPQKALHQHPCTTR
jgi:hypothetical protein